MDATPLDKSSSGGATSGSSGKGSRVSALRLTRSSDDGNTKSPASPVLKSVRFRRRFGTVEAPPLSDLSSPVDSSALLSSGSNQESSSHRTFSFSGILKSHSKKNSWNSASLATPLRMTSYEEELEFRNRKLFNLAEMWKRKYEDAAEDRAADIREHNTMLSNLLNQHKAVLSRYDSELAAANEATKHAEQQTLAQQRAFKRAFEASETQKQRALERVREMEATLADCRSQIETLTQSLQEEREGREKQEADIQRLTQELNGVNETLDLLRNEEILPHSSERRRSSAEDRLIEKALIRLYDLETMRNNLAKVSGRSGKGQRLTKTNNRRMSLDDHQVSGRSMLDSIQTVLEELQIAPSGRSLEGSERDSTEDVRARGVDPEPESKGHRRAESVSSVNLPFVEEKPEPRLEEAHDEQGKSKSKLLRKWKDRRASANSGIRALGELSLKRKRRSRPISAELERDVESRLADLLAPKETHARNGSASPGRGVKHSSSGPSLKSVDSDSDVDRLTDMEDIRFDLSPHGDAEHATPRTPDIHVHGKDIDAANASRHRLHAAKSLDFDESKSSTKMLHWLKSKMKSANN